VCGNSTMRRPSIGMPNTDFDNAPAAGHGRLRRKDAPAFDSSHRSAAHWDHEATEHASCCEKFVLARRGCRRQGVRTSYPAAARYISVGGRGYGGGRRMLPPTPQPACAPECAPLTCPRCSGCSRPSTSRRTQGQTRRWVARNRGQAKGGAGLLLPQRPVFAECRVNHYA
jgi:hypothetical protein